MKRLINSIPVLGPLAKSAHTWIITRPSLARRRIMGRKELLEFWQQRAPEGNVPEMYLEPIGRSRALLALIQDTPKTAKILEVGCNVGRNLNYLYGAGYRNVHGVEISPHAVDLLRKHHPELPQDSIHLGAAEDVLPRFADGEFDLVFTMAVMEHIHPESKEVFDDIGRIAKTILAIEPMKGHTSSRQYPHDLKAIFRAQGYRCVFEKAMWDIPELERDPALVNYAALLFRR